VGVFERYTDQCKRAVFFAQQTALREEAPSIDSGHLLLGLLSEKGTRADTLFHLQELLPNDTVRQLGLVKQHMVRGTIPLTDDGKRIVAYAACEADCLRDSWIDTEHLVLGILREVPSAAADKLRAGGLELEACRQRVIQNKSSRPPRHDPLWWRILRPSTTIGVALQIVFLLGIILGMFLLARQ
jgi:ATP-dependent Clp protease ATP-binding subunit ClpC